MYECPFQFEQSSDGCCSEILLKWNPGLSLTSKKERFTTVVDEF